ncbi:hypothetical protein BH10PLA2_BH10PLA2_26270 [soil metagenome]
MNLTWFDKGVLKGREEGVLKGREEGRKDALIEFIFSLREERFIPMNDDLRTRLNACTTERLSVLAKAVAKGKSLQELGLEP